MNLLAYLRSLAGRLFHRSQVDFEMEEELGLHIQHRTDDLQRSGLTRAEAERRARVEFGGTGRYKEECRESISGHFLEVLVQDARFSLRLLRRSPGFTAAAVLTLALAIGANAVVFGILNGLVLRPLNVPQADNLWGTVYGEESGFQSYRNYLDLRDRNHSFDGLAAFNFTFVGLDKGNDPAAATGYLATGNYFDVLRITPYLGRFFHSSDEHGPNSAPYLVLSYAYWHSHFEDDRNVLGRVVRVDKHPFTIIGVTRPEFRGTLLFISPDFFLPIVNQPQVDEKDLLDSRGDTHGLFEAFGHLKPGVTQAQATADINAIGAALEKAYPKEVSHKPSRLLHQGLTSFGGPVRAFVAGLALLAGMILLAACANLGSLFAARAADRSREVALRLALGSSRNRILRGLLTEAVLIALGGGTVGLLGSIALLRRLSVWQPFPGAPVHIPVDPDARIYIIALALAVVSGLLFGLVPVRQVLRADPYQIVKAGSSGTVGRRITIRDVLLVVQIAICAVLVTSSLVAVRGLLRSLNTDLGFEGRNAMVVSANLATAGYSGEEVHTMQRKMIAAMQAIPGVQGAGLVNNYPPLVNTAASKENVFKEEAADLRPLNVAIRPYRFDISPQYFQAARTRLLEGRDFNWHDDGKASRVAVINRDFAGRVFGKGATALNQYFKLQDGTRIQVVGVVEDGKYLSMTEDQEPAMFLPFLQAPSTTASLVVRSGRDPQQLAAAIRMKVRELDAGLPLETQTWTSMLSVVLFPARVATMALGVLGVMGAMLSITGIFGMAAYSVSRRLKELGIRVALGAQPAELLQTALGRALRSLALGSAAGLILGVLASRVLASIVYQATPRDPLVLTGVVAAMLFLGLLATWIPAQRALSVNPLTLLHED